MQESSVAFNLAELEQHERAARAAYWLSAVLGFGLIGCVALYFGALQPALESTRALAAEAQALAQERADALEQLRSASREAAPLATGVPTVAPAAASSRTPAVRAGATRARPRPAVPASTTAGGAAGDELGDLDLDSDDPFEDAADRPSRRGQKAQRR